MKHIINLCQPSKTENLDPLEFNLSDTDQAIARIARQKIEEQRIEANEREQPKVQP